MAEDRRGPADGPPGEVVELPIDGVLDLHAFMPRDIVDVVREYIDACRDRGILEVRIIHGKGKGVQRAAVRSLLSRLPGVRSFRDAGEGGGGWGATVVDLAPDP